MSLIPAKATISEWHRIPLGKHRFELAQLGTISLAINNLMLAFDDCWLCLGMLNLYSLVG